MFQIAKGHTERNPDHPWDLDKASIFNHIESFVQRNNDLIEICNAMITFGRYSETENLRKPIFGGTKGKIFEKVIDNVEEHFKEYLNEIIESRHIILDILVPTWSERILRLVFHAKDFNLS